MHNFYPILTVSLLLLGYLSFQKKKKYSALFMLLLNISFAIWTSANYLLHYKFFFPYVDIIIATKLVSMALCSFFLYGLSFIYPVKENNHWKLVFLVPCMAFAVLCPIFIPNEFIVAKIIDNEILYQTKTGYALYGAFIATLCMVAFFRLYKSSKQYPAYKAQLSFLIFALSIITFISIFTNIILPSSGVNSYLFVGRLLVPLGFSYFLYYSITRYNFLHIKFMVTPFFSWLLTGLITIFLAVATLGLAQENQMILWIGIPALCLACAYFGRELQTYLMQSTKKNLLSGWYDSKTLVDKMMQSLRYSFEKHQIMTFVHNHLSEEINVTESMAIFAEDLENKQILMEYFGENNSPELLRELPNHIQSALQPNITMDHYDVVIFPFIAIHDLEGLLALGTKTSGKSYTEQDMHALLQVQNIVSAALYRISPLNEREKAYFDSQERIEWMRAFAGNIAHELRTPLASIALINGDIKYAMEKKQYDEQVILSDVNAIENTIESAQKTINILLENIKQRKIAEADLEDTPIAYVIKEALNEYPFYKDQKSLIHFSDDHDFTAKISSQFLKIAVFNLIKNALYYIHQAGKGEIFMHMERGKKYNKLIFKDTAKGIATEHLTKIFDSFFSSKPGVQGHGLGLSFCKHVMEEFGGDIICDSIEGEFIEFTLLFPVEYSQLTYL